MPGSPSADLCRFSEEARIPQCDVAADQLLDHIQNIGPPRDGQDVKKLRIADAERHGTGAGTVLLGANSNRGIRPCFDGIPDFLITKEYQNYCADRGGPIGIFSGFVAEMGLFGGYATEQYHLKCSEFQQNRNIATSWQ